MDKVNQEYQDLQANQVYKVYKDLPDHLDPQVCHHHPDHQVHPACHHHLYSPVCRHRPPVNAVVPARLPVLHNATTTVALCRNKSVLHHVLSPASRIVQRSVAERDPF